MLLWWTVYASSLVDWYWILPRVDGVHEREPPCRSSADPAWGRVTRVWHVHRALAHIACAVMVPVLLATITVAAAPNLPSEALVAVGAAAGAAAVPLLNIGIGALSDYGFKGPPVWVGDTVRWRGAAMFVLHVGTRELVVRPIGRDRDHGRLLSIGHAEVETVPEAFTRCARRGCSGINPACERHPGRELVSATPAFRDGSCCDRRQATARRAG